MLETLFYKKDFIKKKLQHKCFSFKFSKFLKRSILKNICERLPLSLVLAMLEILPKYGHTNLSSNSVTVIATGLWLIILLRNFDMSLSTNILIGNLVEEFSTT